MSIHRSLRTQGKLQRARNVFSRLERVEILKKEKRWDEETSIYGLPKVRARFKVKTKKQQKAAATADDVADSDETPEDKSPSKGESKKS